MVKGNRRVGNRISFSCDADDASRPLFISRFKRWWDLQTMPPLDWMQIEVTTRCNASCLYCPRTRHRCMKAKRCYGVYLNDTLSFTRYSTTLPSSTLMSSSLTSAIRISLRLLAAVSTAFLAASCYRNMDCSRSRLPVTV